jgi:hypothetical protein
MVAGYWLMDITNSTRWRGESLCWDNFVEHCLSTIDGIYEFSGELTDRAIATELAEWNGWTVDITLDDDWVTDFQLWFKTESDATIFVLRWS